MGIADMINGELFTHYLELSDKEFVEAVRTKTHEVGVSDPETAALLAALHFKLEDCLHK